MRSGPPVPSAGAVCFVVKIALGDTQASSIAVTRPSAKHRERFLVEQAAKLLGKTWSIGPDRECPDFIVSEGRQQFGLEVSEIFTGYQAQTGSVMKRVESETQRAVNAERRKYEAITNVALRAQFVGDMCADNMATVIPALVAEDFSSKPIGHHVVIDADNGLRVHVTRVFRAEWFSVNDRVGWVDRNPIQRIADAVEKKSKELPRYKEAAGPDIRLLLVADRYYNSGKLMLEEKGSLDRRGFQIVYFLSHPESVAVFD